VIGDPSFQAYWSDGYNPNLGKSGINLQSAPTMLRAASFPSCASWPVARGLERASHRNSASATWAFAFLPQAAPPHHNSSRRDFSKRRPGLEPASTSLPRSPSGSTSSASSGRHGTYLESRDAVPKIYLDLRIQRPTRPACSRCATAYLLDVPADDVNEKPTVTGWTPCVRPRACGRPATWRRRRQSAASLAVFPGCCGACRQLSIHLGPGRHIIANSSGGGTAVAKWRSGSSRGLEAASTDQALRNRGGDRGGAAPD